MSSRRRNTGSSPRFVVDTSTLFSALYKRNGNEARLFEMAHQGKCRIHIPLYVIEELASVFARKGIDFGTVLEFLELTDNLYISEIPDMDAPEVDVAKRCIDDPKDRPVFVAAYMMTHGYGDRDRDRTYLVSGDKTFFSDRAQDALNGKVLTTRKALEMLEERPLSRGLPKGR